MENNFLYKDHFNIRENYFCFKGIFNEEIVHELGCLIKFYFDSYKHKKKIFSAFIEMSQNMSKYSDERNENNMGIGVFFFKEENNYIYLSTGNIVKKNIKYKIENILKEINFMNKEELTHHYQNTLRKPYLETSTGANLGFIDMRRKTEMPLEFDFNDLTEDYSFFTLTVKFKKEILKKEN